MDPFDQANNIDETVDRPTEQQDESAARSQPLLITIFQNRQAIQKKEKEITLAQMKDLVRDTKRSTKDELLLWKMAKFGKTAPARTACATMRILST